MLNKISKILITKKSDQKMQNITQDYQIISDRLNNKAKNFIHLDKKYKKPSDLLNDLLQDKSINTTEMHLSKIFSHDDIQYLDQQFAKALAQSKSQELAWNNTIFLIHTKLENESDYFMDRELIHSAALVSLQQDGQLPKIFEFNNFRDEEDNIIPFNIEHWSEKDKNEILEKIQTRKKIFLEYKNPQNTKEKDQYKQNRE
jgi:hypothetical protein